MLLGGDELGRTQGGNNNGWCQDNEISWYDWKLAEHNADLRAFAQKLIALRRVHAVFRRRQFLFGREVEGSGLPDVAWFRVDGERMRDEDWDASPPVIGVFLNGEEIAAPDARGRQVLDESFLMLFNGNDGDCTFTLPAAEFGEAWTVVLSTADPGLEPGTVELESGGEADLVSRSVVLLRRARG
jgi:glycogen operon protein